MTVRAVAKHEPLHRAAVSPTGDQVQVRSPPMTRRASAVLDTTRVSSGGAGSALVWTLTQNTLDRARDEDEMQPPSIGRCAQ
jgi:hypothetical protein